MKVVILMGGNSKERQVSLQSGNAIFRACKNIGYDTSVIDMTKDIDFYLSELKKYDLVFIGLHGGEGENGTIQKSLEQNEIIFTGSDSKSSALCMDKNLSKIKAKDIESEVDEYEVNDADYDLKYSVYFANDSVPTLCRLFIYMLYLLCIEGIDPGSIWDNIVLPVNTVDPVEVLYEAGLITKDEGWGPAFVIMPEIQHYQHLLPHDPTAFFDTIVSGVGPL